MRRWVVLLILLGPLLAGCGGSSQADLVPAHPEIYLGAKRTVDLGAYVRRRLDGLSLLVPADLATGALNVFSPPMLAAGINPSPNLHLALTTTAAEIDRPHRVELIARGPHSAEVSVFWEESCGARHLAPEAAMTADSGGELIITAQLPVVVLAPQPRQRGASDRCYLRAAALPAADPTPRRGTVTLEIVNH